ncbi:MAG: agmatinase family protein [Thermomicrobiales bacterium]|nr:agmatinase family protein [Thermomicrobiales bacterium]
MRLSSDAEKLLLPADKVGKFVPDEYDIELADLIKEWREVDRVDVGFLGIPFDTSVMIRRGCRFGPSGVRKSLMMSTSFEPGLNVDLAEGITIADFGDVDVIHTDVNETHRRIETVMTSLFEAGVMPVVIGGDHGTAYASIKALTNVADGQIGVINIDAHLDVRISHHGEISSGTPFRRLLDIPGQPLRPENFVEVGINGWHNSAFYMNWCREQGITIFPAREVHQRGIETVIAEALEIASRGVEALYISFDIDSLDAAFAPGTCAPNPGGLTAYQGLEAVFRAVQHPKVRGFDVVEVAPPLDVLDLTSYMGAAIAMHAVGATKVRLEAERLVTA